MMRHIRSDGFQVVGIGGTSSVELYFGDRSLVSYAINYKTAVAILRFLVRWWFLDAYCGLRGRYEAWKLSRDLNRKASSCQQP